MRYLRVTRPSGGASHVYATPPEEIRVVPLVNEVEGAVERVRAFRDGQIRYFDRDRATGKVVASSAKLSTLHEDLVDAVERRLPGDVCELSVVSYAFFRTPS